MLCVLALGQTSRAKSVTEVEGAAYQGSSSGDWGCGPSGRLHYGGLGAQLRHSQREPSPQAGRGATITVGGAVELQRSTTDAVIPDPWDSFGEPLPQNTTDSTVTNHGVFGAFHARGGYHFRYVGAELGIAAWSGFESYRSSGADWVALPQIELTLGPRDVFYMVGGFGVAQLTQTMRYSLPYVGAGFALGKRSLLELRVSASRSGPAVATSLAPRLDALWLVPIDARWSLRAGLGLADGESRLDREASLGLALRL